MTSNELQRSREKSVVVSGVVLWWKQQLLIGCYSVVKGTGIHELCDVHEKQMRIYPAASPGSAAATAPLRTSFRRYIAGANINIADCGWVPSGFHCG